MYSKIVLDRFISPIHAGLIKNADVVSSCINEITGDTVKLYMLVEEDKIVEAKFKAYGSPLTICAADLMCEMLLQKTFDEAKIISNKEIEDKMNMPSSPKLHASVMAEELILEATKIFEKKK